MIYANAIRARLWNVAEFTEAHAVSGYHSTGSEVYTGDILRDVLARGTRLCLPRTGQNDTINFYEISDMDSLQIGKYGILEPHDRCKQCTDQEVMLVPAVCATAKCQRIGAEAASSPTSTVARHGSTPSFFRWVTAFFTDSFTFFATITPSSFMPLTPHWVFFSF